MLRNLNYLVKKKIQKKLINNYYLKLFNKNNNFNKMIIIYKMQINKIYNRISYYKNKIKFNNKFNKNNQNLLMNLWNKRLIKFLILN